MATSNRELRALTEEIDGNKRLLPSANKSSRPSIRNTLPSEENGELWKGHYNQNMEQLKTLKKKEAYEILNILF